MVGFREETYTLYIVVIKDMYNKAVTSVRTIEQETNALLINVYQGSSLSSYLFALVWMNLLDMFKIESHGACCL